MQDFYIYTKESKADYAYMLKEGSVYVEIDGEEGFNLEGSNLVLGTSEILLSREDNYAHYRMFGLKATKDTRYTRVEPKTVLDVIGHYNTAFAIAKTVALTLLNLNMVFTMKKEEAGEKEKLSQEYCKTYARAVDILALEYEQKRFPWLEDLVARHKSSLEYSKGQAFLSLSQTTRIEMKGSKGDKFSKIFSPGSIICRQGEEGDELYILRRGKLKVSINDRPITVISEKGSVIGEMALLLSEVRSATMEAMEETVLTVVKKGNLKTFAEEHPMFLAQIIVELSRRMEKNCAALFQLISILKHSKEEDNTIPHALRENKYRRELQVFRDEIKVLSDRYEMEWIAEILARINSKLQALKR